jgi:2-phosphoglycerate kinase
MKRIAVIGVSGTGKSTYSQYLASQIYKEKSVIVPTDMIKDGVRFMILNQIFPNNLTYEEMSSIKEPSKKCDLRTGSQAAYTVSKIRNILPEILYSGYKTIIFDGFFIPHQEEDIILLTANEKWLTNIHTKRAVLRKEREDPRKIDSYVKNSLALQKFLINELNIKNLKYNSIETPANIPVIKKSVNKFLNLEDYLNPIFLRLGIDHKLARTYFMKGMNHAYRRTTDLK